MFLQKKIAFCFLQYFFKFVILITYTKGSPGEDGGGFLFKKVPAMYVIRRFLSACASLWVPITAGPPSLRLRMWQKENG
jgi:hypothetical protein